MFKYLNLPSTHSKKTISLIPSRWLSYESNPIRPDLSAPVAKSMRDDGDSSEYPDQPIQFDIHTRSRSGSQSVSRFAAMLDHPPPPLFPLVSCPACRRVLHYFRINYNLLVIFFRFTFRFNSCTGGGKLFPVPSPRRIESQSSPCWSGVRERVCWLSI